MPLVSDCAPWLTHLTITASPNVIAGNLLRTLLVQLNPGKILELRCLVSRSRILPALEQLATSPTGFRNLRFLSLQVPLIFSTELRSFMASLAKGTGHLEALEFHIETWFQFDDISQHLKTLSENNSKTFKQLSFSGLSTFGTSAEHSMLQNVFRDTLRCEISPTTTIDWKQVDTKCKEYFGVHLSGFSFLNQKLWSAVTASFCDHTADFSVFDELFELCYGSRPSFQATDAICGGWGELFSSACTATVVYFCSKALFWLSDIIWANISFSEARAAIQCGFRLFDGVRAWLAAHPDHSSIVDLHEKIYNAILKYLSYNPMLMSFYASRDFLRRFLDDVPSNCVDFYHIWNDYTDSFSPLQPFLEDPKVLRTVLLKSRDAIFWFSPAKIVPDLIGVEEKDRNSLIKSYLRSFKQHPRHQHLLEFLDVDCLTKIVEVKALRKLFFKMLASSLLGIKLITFLLGRLREHARLDDKALDDIRDIISKRLKKSQVDDKTMLVYARFLQQELPHFGRPTDHGGCVT